MSERNMRQKVVRMLHPLDAFAVENPAWPGTPDVNYREGWIELKWLREWPARGGVVRIEHFTKQQRYFLRQRWEYGGNVFFLLNVKREWLLFNGNIAARTIGLCDHNALKVFALKHWPKGLVVEEFIRCLSR